MAPSPITEPPDGRPPPHPGLILRQRVLPGLGLSVSRASRELGVCRQTLHHVLAGTAALTPNMATRLARLSGLPARFWLDLQQAHDLARAEADLAGVLASIPAYALPDAIRMELWAHGH
jgi:antitoxin HigA-1